MDFLWNIIVTLIIYVLIEETVSKQIWYPYESPKTPLVMIQSRDEKLSLATPEKYGPQYAAYVYDDTMDNNMLQNKIFIACPIQENIAMQLKWQENLQKENKLSKDSKLFIAQEYGIGKSECVTNLIPSIEKSEKDTNKSDKEEDNGNAQHCGQAQTAVYDVGYPVIKKENKEDVKFMAIYQICYSTAKGEGMLYTIHRIISPKLLLQKLWEFYELNLEVSLKTSLNHEKDINNESSNENHYAYQFVGFDDMPTKAWERATLFSINYTLIPKNEELIKGMIIADNYIRLFSKKTNKPLTLYSGSHETTVSTAPPELTKISSFWRVIMDDESNAVIIVTQHTEKECSEDYLCNENRVIVQRYKQGGCTYTCSVDDDVIKLLRLPQLKIKGDLTLKFPREIPTEKAESSQAQDEQQSSEVKSSTDISLSDFMGKDSFMSVLKEVDADLANKVVHFANHTLRG